jgi:hypothetical protein
MKNTEHIKLVFATVLRLLCAHFRFSEYLAIFIIRGLSDKFKSLSDSLRQEQKLDLETVI